MTMQPDFRSPDTRIQRVVFTAQCPSCGTDATWQVYLGYGFNPRYRIYCAVCLGNQ
jgi:hypothetical protein